MRKIIRLKHSNLRLRHKNHWIYHQTFFRGIKNHFPYCDLTTISRLQIYWTTITTTKENRVSPGHSKLCAEIIIMLRKFNIYSVVVFFSLVKWRNDGVTNKVYTGRKIAAVLRLWVCCNSKSMTKKYSMCAKPKHLFVYINSDRETEKSQTRLLCRCSATPTPKYIVDPTEEWTQ